MPDEAKPEDTENLPQIQSSAEKTRSASMTERLENMRAQGVTVIDSSMTGRNIAIVGASSGPTAVAPQPVNGPKQETDMENSSRQTTPKIEQRPGESMRASCDRILLAAGSKKVMSETPGSVSAIIGMQPTEPEADPRAQRPGEKLYDYLKRLGVKIANDDLPNSGGITIVGTGQPSEPEDE